jgi:hypothetical protein
MTLLEIGTADEIVESELNLYANWLADDMNYDISQAQDRAMYQAHRGKERLLALFSGHDQLSPVQVILLDGIFLHILRECEALHQDHYQQGFYK